MYHILVYEKDIVHALEIYLKSDGYQVYKAYNGIEALDILQADVRKAHSFRGGMDSTNNIKI